MKQFNYFPVQKDNYTTTRSLSIRMNYGWQGYGIYFALLQKLASTEHRRLEFSKVNEICFDLHCTKDELQPIIDNYMTVDDKYFFSEELDDWMKYYDDKYNKMSEAGKKAQASKTPEQRKADAKKAADTRWDKGKKASDNAEVESDTKVLASECEGMPANSASDAENRIEQNRMEKNRTELNGTEQNRTEEPVPGFSSVEDSVSDLTVNNNYKDVISNIGEVIGGSTPVENDDSIADITPIGNKGKLQPIKKDQRFLEELKRFNYDTTKVVKNEFKCQYFNNQLKIQRGYEKYVDKNPNQFLPLDKFESVLAYYIFQCVPDKQPTNDIINKEMIYADEYFMNLLPTIHSIIKDMSEDRDYTAKILSLVVLPDNSQPSLKG